MTVADGAPPNADRVPGARAYTEAPIAIAVAGEVLTKSESATTAPMRVSPQTTVAKKNAAAISRTDDQTGEELAGGDSADRTAERHPADDDRLGLRPDGIGHIDDGRNEEGEQYLGTRLVLEGRDDRREVRHQDGIAVLAVRAGLLGRRIFLFRAS